MADGLNRIGFIGAGKVGNTLARLLHMRGYTVGAVYSRKPHQAQLLAERVDADIALTPEQVIVDCDLTLLTVPDDALRPLAEGLEASLGSALEGKGIVHTSGANDARVLAGLAANGAIVGSLHPAFPFADVETSILNLPGAVFAVEAENERLREWLLGLVAAMDGKALAIAPHDKGLYHTALVMASNYTVTLYALAERLLMHLGAERSVADGALNSLMAGTVENLRVQGVPDALTGPLTRADVGTIETHLAALEVVDVQAAEVYRQLARLTFPLLRARNVNLEELERLFNQE